MTQPLKPREFWIDLDDYMEAEICDETREVISVDSYSARKECPHEDAVHVVEYSAYKKAVEALKFYAKDKSWEESEAYAERLNIYGDARLLMGHYRVGGKLANEVLKELREL